MPGMHTHTRARHASTLGGLLALALDAVRLAWTLGTAPLRKAAREARSCRRVQLGYRCHSYLPQGCEACGRVEHRPVQR